VQSEGRMDWKLLSEKVLCCAQDCSTQQECEQKTFNVPL